MLGDGQADLIGTLNWGTPLLKHGFRDLAGGYRSASRLRRTRSWRARPRLVAGLAPAGGRPLRRPIAAGDGDTPGDKVTRHLVGPVLLLSRGRPLDVFAGSWHTPSARTRSR